MNQKQKNFISYTIWIAFSVFCGISLSYFSLNLAKFTYNQSKSLFDGVYTYQAAGVSNKYFKKPNKRVSIIFVGDIMLDRGVKYSVFKNGKGDFSFIFNNADFLEEADITFGNLEGPISDTGENKKNLYSFRMRPVSFEALRKAGFDALSVANNHAGDWGRDAFEDTLFRLKNGSILAIGGGYNKKDASSARIINKNGLKIGFLGFSDVGPDWMKAGDLSGILIIDDDFKNIIGNASSEVDFLVVSIHFGEEYYEKSNVRQKMIARNAIDSGADIIIGHHPHVVQEIEKYNGGIIAYSLGNFIFDQNFSEETMQGLVLRIILNKDGVINIMKFISTQNKFFQPSLLEQL